MDSKAKHRILGLLVVAGIIVILLPFIEGGKELSSDTALVKAPPFPDQSMQVSVVAPATPAPAAPASASPTQSNANAASTDASTPVNEGAEKRPIAITTPIVGAVNPDNLASNGQPDDIIRNSHNKITVVAPAIQNPLVTPDAPSSPKDIPAASSAVKVQTVPLMSSPAKAVKNEDISPAEIDNRISHTITASMAAKSKKSLAMAKRVNSKLHHPTLATRGPIDNNGLVKLKGSAWVIQIGSFKNKASALRLVNQLRSKGYRAFIQQLASESGESTRVFIGPEVQQASARALVRELETEMHVRGIVISYTPLEL